MLKGLDAFFTQEPQRSPLPSTPAPPPDTKEETPRAAGPERSATDIGAMLSAFERHADPPSDPEPSVVERVPFSEDLQQEITGPVLVHDSEAGKRALLSAIGEGLGGASRYASGLGSRTKDYLGSARSNFTRPVFNEPARPRSRKKRKKKPLRIDAREAAVIALSIVGLAEVGWIGWRVANPPPTSLVANRGARSSQAATVEPIATPPAPARSAPRAKSTPPPVAHAKMAAPTPESASTKGTTPPPAVAKDTAPAPESTATAGNGSGWVTMPLSPPVEVFERGRKLASRDGRVTLPAGRHDLQFRNKALGIDTRRTVEVVATRGVRGDRRAARQRQRQCAPVGLGQHRWRPRGRHAPGQPCARCGAARCRLQAPRVRRASGEGHRDRRDAAARQHRLALEREVRNVTVDCDRRLTTTDRRLEF